MSIPEGPWKVITAGQQWAVTRSRAARDEDDICMGTQYHDEWQSIAKAISAIPDMLGVLAHLNDFYGDGSTSPDPKMRMHMKLVNAALKKAR